MTTQIKPTQKVQDAPKVTATSLLLALAEIIAGHFKSGDLDALVRDRKIVALLRETMSTKVVKPFDLALLAYRQNVDADFGYATGADGSLLLDKDGNAVEILSGFIDRSAKRGRKASTTVVDETLIY